MKQFRITFRNETFTMVQAINIFMVRWKLKSDDYENVISVVEVDPE